jgi:rod shape-determining protein MreD
VVTADQHATGIDRTRTNWGQVSPIAIARVRLAGLLVAALVVQTTIVPNFRVLGVCADLMLLCTVGAALAGGPELGALVGFVAGLMTDLFLQATPLGLSALSYSLVGYAVGSARGTVLQEGWLLAPGAAFVATAAGVVTFVIAGVMVGQSQLTRVGPLGIVKTATIVGILNAIVAVPVCWVVAWAAAGSNRSAPGAEVSAKVARRSSRLVAGGAVRISPGRISAARSSARSVRPTPRHARGAAIRRAARFR